jgi:hypothetical protein
MQLGMIGGQNQRYGDIKGEGLRVEKAIASRTERERKRKK